MEALANLILKEGWRPVGIAATAALLLSILDLPLFALIALIVALLLVWVYRLPARSVIHFEKGSITSPCDGKVTAIRTNWDGTMSVDIESGCLDASILSAPFEGEAVVSPIVRGARLPRNSPLYEVLNEYGSVAFTDNGGRSVQITHRLTRWSAPLVFDEQTLKARLFGSQRYGVMVSGMTTVEVPSSTRIAVNPGEQVVGAETLLGYMN